MAKKPRSLQATATKNIAVSAKNYITLLQPGQQKYILVFAKIQHFLMYNSAMEIIGWIGAGLFAMCGLPQAVQSSRDGHSRGLSWLFLLMWFWGEIFTLIYIWPKMDYPLLVNYLTSTGFLIIILFYKISPRGTK